MKFITAARAFLAGMPVIAPKFYRIGEVSKLLKVEPHVLRYWEEEFYPWVRTTRSTRGQRVYSSTAVAYLAVIRDLLWVEQYTIAGARRVLAKCLDEKAPAMLTHPEADLSTGERGKVSAG